MTDKNLVLAFQQLVKALLTRPGEFRAERSESGADMWGVVVGREGLVYEYDFSRGEAEIIAALLNWNEELEWNDIAAIVTQYEPDVYYDGSEE